MKNAPEKKDTLLLITSHFPFDGGESFLETEIKYLQECFRHIIIVARDTESTQTRNIHTDIKCFRYNPTSSVSDYLFLPFLIIANLEKVWQALKSEIYFRQERQEKVTLKKLKIIIRAISKALQLKHFLTKIINKVSPEENVILYSYWMNSAAHAIALLNSGRAIKITRAHRGDLYEELSPKGILPLQRFSSSNTDHVFLISENGNNYLKNHLKVNGANFSVSRLGVSYNDVLNPYSRHDIFTVVSCSNLSPVKRVDMIIKALSIISSSRPVHWYHFGSGALEDELFKLAEEKLKDKKNLEWHFSGAVSNKYILDFYNNNSIDLFINASSSEGIPVSIMEAQIFGIPVIATDCGGTGEIVVNGTGTLLHVNSSIEDFAVAIENYINLEENEYLAMRQRIAENQQVYFSAEKNYSAFAEEMMKLAEQKFTSNHNR